MRCRSLLLASVSCVGLIAMAGCGGSPVVLEEHTGDLEATRVVVDLVERANSAEIIRDTPTIDIGSTEATGALIHGWSDPEVDSASDATFAWAIADRAVVETDLLQTDIQELHLRCRPFEWEGSPEQQLEVSVNGRKVGVLVLTSGFNDYSMQLPDGSVSVGLNRVDFRFSWTAAPADHLPANSDRRTLAAAFQWLRFGAMDPQEKAFAESLNPAAAGTEVVIPQDTGLRYRLTVPENAVLDFGLAARPSTASDLRALVSVGRPGKPAARSVLLEPMQVVGGRVRLVIGAAAGETIELVMATTGHGPDGAVLAYHTPRVLGSEGPGSEIASVLLIVVDTLRADYLGVYGADVDTPNVDALAARGVRFSQARSHIPITGPSHSSLFTSLLPMEHGVLNNAQELTDRFPTMAESLRSSGRRTAAVISLGVMQRQFGFSRGFDRYGDGFPRDWMKDAAEVTDETLVLAEGVIGAPYFLWVHYSDPHEPYAPPGLDYPRIEIRLDDRSLGQIDTGGRGYRFDLDLPPGASRLEFVSIDDDPGRSYRFDTLIIDDPDIEVEPMGGWRLREKRIGRPTYQTKLPATLRLTNSSELQVSTGLLLTCKQLLRKPEIRSRYAGEVEFADREIGRLLSGLEARGLMENTLVIFASDHGEGLGNHDHVGHVSQLYDTLLQVPLIFVWPDHLPEGLVIDHPVSLIDVVPTVVDLLGLSWPAAATGTSLMPLFRGELVPERPFLAVTYPPESASDKRAILLDGHKFIHSWTTKRDWVELYNVVEDPGELEDLARTKPELLELLRNELQRQLMQISESSAVEVELSEEDKAHLRALGYVR